MNNYKRAKMTINLLDETQSVAMSWELSNAIPIKMSATDMRSDGDEIAIESMEFAHEGLSIVS
jgi:phage tail-like protein